MSFPRGQSAATVYVCVLVCTAPSRGPGGTGGGDGGVLATVFSITAQRAVLVLYPQATARMPPITSRVKLGHMLCSGQGVRSGRGAGHVLEGTLGAGFQLASRGDGGRVDTMSGWPASLGDHRAPPTDAHGMGLPKWGVTPCGAQPPGSKDCCSRSVSFLSCLISPLLAT